MCVCVCVCVRERESVCVPIRGCVGKCVGCVWSVLIGDLLSKTYLAIHLRYVGLYLMYTPGPRQITHYIHKYTIILYLSLGC